MRKKLIYIIIIVFVFFLGATGAYLIMKYYPLTTETISKVVNQTKIEETAVEGAIEKVYDAVVVVESIQDNQLVATGTGFVYKKDDKVGYIITNNHVISGGNKAEVILTNGEKVEAKILGSDTYADIAVLSIPANKVIKVATMGSTGDINLGGTVFAIGAPIGTEYSGTVTRGIVSGKDRIVSISLDDSGNNESLVKVIQTDAAINPGNSGGPLVDLAGSVIGITSSKLVEEDVEGIGFAIPIEDAMLYVSKLEKGEAIVRPVLGVALLDTDELYALYYNKITVDKDVEGAVVVSVDDGSSAKEAGLQKGDVITKIGDKTVKGKAELKYELYKHNVGDKINITYYRSGKEKTIAVTLKASKE